MEKDKTTATLQRTIATIDQRRGAPSAGDAVDAPTMVSLTATLPEYQTEEREEIEGMHEALRRIAAEVNILYLQNLILKDDLGNNIS